MSQADADWLVSLRGVIFPTHTQHTEETFHGESHNRDRPSRVRSRRGGVDECFGNAGRSALKERA
jgi:hypothetical protein